MQVFLCASNLITFKRSAPFQPKAQLVERQRVVSGVQHTFQPAKTKRLENHESYLMCPGKAAIKLDTNFPVSRFRVFYKNFHRSSSPSSSSSLSQSSAESLPQLPPANLQRQSDRYVPPRHYVDVYHWVAWHHFFSFRNVYVLAIKIKTRKSPKDKWTFGDKQMSVALVELIVHFFLLKRK